MLRKAFDGEVYYWYEDGKSRQAKSRVDMTTKPQSTTEPIKAPERVKLWICCHCQMPRTVGLTVCERCGKRLHDVVEYIRAPASTAPVVDKSARKLTLPEINHLSALLEAERESGSYAGPREQYYARTERLIKWCNDQIGE